MLHCCYRYAHNKYKAAATPVFASRFIGMTIYKKNKIAAVLLAKQHKDKNYNFVINLIKKNVILKYFF